MALQTTVGVTKEYKIDWTLAGAAGSVEGVPAWSLEPPGNGAIEMTESGNAKITLSVEGDTMVKVVGDNIQGEVVGALEVMEMLTAAAAPVVTADGGAITEADI